MQSSPNSTFRINFRLVDDNEDDVVASKNVAVIFNVTLTASTTFSVPTDFEGITVQAILINTTPPPLSAEIAYDEDYSGLYSFKLNC